jgi:hypothetical protein
LLSEFVLCEQLKPSRFGRTVRRVRPDRLCAKRDLSIEKFKFDSLCLRKAEQNSAAIGDLIFIFQHGPFSVVVGLNNAEIRTSFLCPTSDTASGVKVFSARVQKWAENEKIWRKMVAYL